jgi:hypothetical protein
MSTIYRSPLRIRKPRVVRAAVGAVRLVAELTALTAALLTVGIGAFLMVVGYSHG